VVPGQNKPGTTLRTPQVRRRRIEGRRPIKTDSLVKQRRAGRMIPKNITPFRPCPWQCRQTLGTMMSLF
jgi:hypothetical protein